MSLVDKFVKTTLDLHWDGNVPINILNISRRMGVLPVVNYEDEKFVETKIQYSTAPPSATIVNITTSHPLPMRVRFCAAHALGHFLLGHNMPPDKCCTVENFGLYGDQVELDANEFARKILVPTDAFNMVAVKGHSFDEISRIFNVSEVLLKKRLEEIIG